MESAKRLKVFRNASDVRVFYLKRRPDQPETEVNFVLKPGQTVQALDEHEEKMLATISTDLRDVEKESPTLANTLDTLQKQLADEKAKNAALLEENTSLQERVKVTARAASRK